MIRSVLDRRTRLVTSQFQLPLRFFPARRGLLDHAVHPGLFDLGRSEQSVALLGEKLDLGLVLTCSKIERGLEIVELQVVPACSTWRSVSAL